MKTSKMQAKSLAEGTPGSFARSNEFTILSSSCAIGPVIAPWGYPVLLAPAYATFGLNLFALHPGLLAFPNNLLSDLPFLLLSTLSVVLIGALVVERRRIFSSFWDSVLLGGLIAAAYFVRTNGALLLVTLYFSQIVSYLAGRHE